MIAMMLHNANISSVSLWLWLLQITVILMKDIFKLPHQIIAVYLVLAEIRSLMQILTLKTQR